MASTSRRPSSSTSGQSQSTAPQATQQQPSYLSHLNYDAAKHPYPSGWNTKDKCSLIELSRQQLRIHYTGTGKNDGDAAAVRANCPIPAQCGIFYFEVTVISKGRDGYIGIGFCAQSVSLIRLPGWEPNSYGYHGDDGHSFACSGTGKPYGPTFTTGDIIGCCVNFVNNTCFYTKNGVHLGTAFKKLSGLFYPCVGLRTPGEVVEANFGQRPFFFDIEHYVMNEKSTLYQKVNKNPVMRSMSAGTGYRMLNLLVMRYLVHHGYSESALAFAKGASTAAAAAAAATNDMDIDSTTNINISSSGGKIGVASAGRLTCPDDIPFSVEALAADLSCIKDRQHVRDLILAGDMLTAIAATQERYPSVLTSNPSVLFALRVRHFVELILRFHRPPSIPLSATATTAGDTAMGEGAPRRQTRASKAAAEAAAAVRGKAPASHTNSPVPPSPQASATNVTNSSMDWLEEVMRYGQTLQDDYHGSEDPTYGPTLEEAFSLLAYADPFTSPVAHLLSESGREPVANALNSAILVDQEKPPVPAVEQLFRHSCVMLEELGRQGIGASAMIHPHRDLLDRS